MYVCMYIYVGIVSIGTLRTPGSKIKI